MPQAFSLYGKPAGTRCHFQPAGPSTGTGLREPRLRWPPLPRSARGSARRTRLAQPGLPPPAPRPRRPERGPASVPAPPPPSPGTHLEELGRRGHAGRLRGSPRARGRLRFTCCASAARLARPSSASRLRPRLRTAAGRPGPHTAQAARESGHEAEPQTPVSCLPAPPAPLPLSPPRTPEVALRALGGPGGAGWPRKRSSASERRALSLAGRRPGSGRSVEIRVRVPGLSEVCIDFLEGPADLSHRSGKSERLP